MTTQSLGAVIGQATFAYVLMAIIACLAAVLIRAIVAVLARTQKTAPIVAPPLTVSARPVGDDPSMIAAVLAAAVHATLGAHRLVSFTESPSQSAWAREARARHHTSHTPHR